MSFLGSDRDNVSPGLALKLFVDGRPSANLSALYSLDGQGAEQNIFAHTLTTAVDEAASLSGKFSSLLFRRVSRYPRRLAVSDFAAFRQDGTRETKPVAPFQIFFRPLLGAESAAKENSVSGGFREQLDQAPVDAKVYEVLAASFSDYGHPPEEILELGNKETDARAAVIGHLTLKSIFLASAYGDDWLFFKHQGFD